MTVRVNKPAFNIREKLSELERPIGLKGSELMKSETVQDARDFVSAGRKNLVINGAMEIAQRGTSGTKSGNSYGGYLCVDRWASYYDGTGMEQVERTINNKLKKALRITAGGSNGRPYVYHKIENSSKFLGDGTPFSISFWMRASASTVQQLQWRYYDNGNENNGTTHLIKNLVVTTEWQYYKIENLSIPDPSQNRTRDGGLWNYNMNNEIGTGFWIEFTDVQIEVGKNATEFEHRPIGEEFALCQRYYQNTNGNSAYGGTNYGETAYTGWQYDATAGSIRIRLPVQMRTNPTASVVGSVTNNPGTDGTIGAYGNGGWMNITGITATETSPLSLRINVTGLSGSGKDAWGLYFYGSYLTANIKVDAEL